MQSFIIEFTMNSLFVISFIAWDIYSRKMIPNLLHI